MNTMPLHKFYRLSKRDFENGYLVAEFPPQYSDIVTANKNVMAITTLLNFPFAELLRTVERLEQLTKAQSDLLACYRLGKRPSEKTLDTLTKLNSEQP